MRHVRKKAAVLKTTPLPPPRSSGKISVMIALTGLSIALLLWTALYCVRKAMADFRGATPASGILGLVAAFGAMLPIGVILFALLKANSGV